MDDHFDRMLAPAAQGSVGGSTRPSFLPAMSYKGSRPGYIFQMNKQGLGYYLDPLQKRGEEEVEGGVYNEESKKRKLNEISSDQKQTTEQSAIDKLLEEADSADIELLTVESLKKLLLSFEKKISKNQKLRMKYPDEPEKFMDSEIELHEELNNLYALSASPELYPTFVQSGSVVSLLGMVAHENTDISLAAVGLLQELTEPETIAESEDTTIVLVDELLKGQLLELLVQNLSRMDETNEEDSQGVHDSFSILENLLEIRPSLALTMGEKTYIFKFILNRLCENGFDQNKLHASELMSMLLQNEASNAKKLANVPGVDDGFDTLLQILAQYRKHDPESIEEKEYVQNLFLCLCTTLMDVDNQRHFRSCEGMQLMVRFLKENKFAASCACRAITYAVSNNRENCQQFVSAGGFRYIFPLFMGRGFPPHSSKGTKREMESASISIVSQLCVQLHDVSHKDISQRLLAKFVENEHEKTDRAVELFVKFSSILAKADQKLEEEIVHLTHAAKRSGPEGEAAELELEILSDADAQYVKRMDSGLHMLQQLSIIIAYVCVHNFSNSSLLTKIRNKLSVDGCALSQVLDTLREFAANIEISNAASESQQAKSEGDKKTTEVNEGTLQRQTLIEWSACLRHILQNSN